MFVETGIYANGCSAQAVGDLFEERYVIDVDPDQCREVSAADAGIVTIAGDSAYRLPILLGEYLDRPALFWLDAHAISEDEGLPACPLLRELDAIVNWMHADQSVVLIDDARLMGVVPTWPSLGAVVGICRQIWETVVQDDIVRCTPR